MIAARKNVANATRSQAKKDARSVLRRINIASRESSVVSRQS
jgi:hypothetical protein